MLFYDQYDDIEKIAEEKIDKSEIKDKDFALIIEGNKREHRKFATVDKEVTEMSTAYFIKNIDKLPEEHLKIAGANLKEACFKFDIEVPKILEGFDMGGTNRAKIVKEASDDDFGIVIQGDKKFPLRNKDEVAKAMRQFDNIKDRLTDEQRKTLSTKIQEKAKRFGIQTETTLEHNPDVVKDMELRTKRLPTDKKKPYEKLASMVCDKEISVEDGIKVMERLDTENNIFKRCLTPKEVLSNQKRNSDIDPDFLKFFEKEKVANPTENLKYVLQDEKTSKKIIGELKERFDGNLIDSLIEDPDTILNSLPDPHKELINSIVDEAI